MKQRAYLHKWKTLREDAYHTHFLLLCLLPVFYGCIRQPSTHSFIQPILIILINLGLGIVLGPGRD